MGDDYNSGSKLWSTALSPLCGLSFELLSWSVLLRCEANWTNFLNIYDESFGLCSSWNILRSMPHAMSSTTWSVVSLGTTVVLWKRCTCVMVRWAPERAFPSRPFQCTNTPAWPHGGAATTPERIVGWKWETSNKFHSWCRRCTQRKYGHNV